MPYPPQGGGVATFLGLSDTPADYAGQALRHPRVNAGENALEFWTLPPIPGEPVYPVFDDTVIYPAAPKNSTWEDLDCGVGQAIVYLKVGISAGESKLATFRQKGETTDSIPAVINVARFDDVPLEKVAYVMLPTDSSGYVQWKYLGVQNVTITRIGYWQGVDTTKQLLLDGFTDTAWTELDCQVKRALAILLIQNDHVDGFIWYGRIKGDGDAMKLGITQCNVAGVGVYQAGYVLVATDAAGKYEMKANWAGRDMRIFLVGYILGADFRNGEEFFPAGNPPAAWADLDTVYPRGFLYLRHKHSGGAGYDEVRFRQNGEGESPEVSSNLVGSSVSNNEYCYNFVPLDVSGIVEWKGLAATTSILEAIAVSH